MLRRAWRGLGMWALAWPATALATGIETPEVGAWALGRGGAISARPPVGLALQFNPAGLSAVPGLQLQLGGRATWQQVAFVPALGGLWPPGAGLAQNLASPVVGPSDASIAGSMATSGLVRRVGFGAGIAGPSAAGRLSYPASGAQRYDKIEVDNLLAFGSLGGAVQLGPVALGATLQLARGRLGLSQAIVTYEGLGAQPDSLAHLRADVGWRPAAVLGVSVRPHRRLWLGASWRPALTLTARGRLQLQLSPSLAKLATVRGEAASLQLPLPHVVRVGGELMLHRRAQLAADLVFEGWGVMRTLEVVPNNILIDAPLVGPSPLPPLRLHKDWQPTLAGRVGLEWELWPRHLAARAGYFYEPSAIPTATFGVDFPNGPSHGLCAGLTWTLGGLQLDAAVARQVRPQVAVVDGITLPAAGGPLLPSLVPINNGRYFTSATVVAVGLRLSLDHPLAGAALPPAQEQDQDQEPEPEPEQERDPAPAQDAAVVRPPSPDPSLAPPPPPPPPLRRPMPSPLPAPPAAAAAQDSLGGDRPAATRDRPQRHRSPRPGRPTPRRPAGGGHR